MRTGFLATTLLLLPACSLSIGGSSYHDPRVHIEEEETFTLEATGVERVVCETHNGGVRASAGASDSIVVVVRKRAGGRDVDDARDCMDAIEITQSKRDGAVKLGWRWNTSRRPYWQSGVAFEIEQPRDVEFRAESHNGGVEAVGLERGVHLTTHNGRIQLRECRGPLRALSHNGQVIAAIESYDVRIETHNGAVELSLHGEGPLGGSVLTHNGPVSVQLDEGISTRLVCSTNNGSVRAHGAFDTVISKKNVLVADVGGGGAELEVETHNGSIVVR